MNFYFTKRIASFFLSIVLTASLAASFFGVTSVCYARSDSVLYECISAYSDELKTDLDAVITERMPESELPTEAFTQAVDGEAIDFLISASANNIAKQNGNDFSLSQTLYDTIKTNLSQYASDNGIKIKNHRLSNLASLEVDVISGFMSQANTADVALYRVCRNKAALIIIAVSVVMALSSYALIYVVNDGRHRKNSYIGMAFVSTGYIQIVGTVVAILIGASDKMSSCGYAPFDSGVSDVIERIMNIQIPFGIVLLATGIAVLITNYIYFWKKNKKVNEQRQLNSDMRDEYMKHYKRVKGEEKEYVHGERETMDIDF